MELKSILNKGKQIIIKYKYPCLLLIVGIAILLIPDKKIENISTNNSNPETLSYHIKTEELAEILQTVDGAGRVQVFLSVSSGEKTIYQINQESSESTGNIMIETVIVSDSQRNETGLVSQVNPPVYLGAIVVCQGADRPAVKLAITQAVSKITGLGTDNICVLKMK